MNRPEEGIKGDKAGLVTGYLLSFAGYLVAGVAILYFIMSSLAPVRYIRNLNHTYGYDTLGASPSGIRMASDSLFLAISSGVSFLNARTRMAASDSVGFSVNLPDSLLSLEIKGVTVREVPVISYKTAPALKGITGYALTQLLSEPLTIVSSKSTILKEPIVMVRAPRDAAEASLIPAAIPDTTAIEPVCFLLTLENGLRLLILQETTGNDDDHRRIRRFLIGLKVSETWRDLKRAILFGVPDFEPRITIVVSKVDARVVYRSIPMGGEVTLRVR